MNQEIKTDSNNDREGISDFAVIIPAYNEEKNIINTIEETVKVLDSFNPNYEILVVNDGSIDNTGNEVADFLSDKFCIVFSQLSLCFYHIRALGETTV